MGYDIIGNCPRCGAPIYAQSPWWGITPPPSMYSCNCFSNSQPQIVTTTHIPLDYINLEKDDKNLEKRLEKLEKENKELKRKIDTPCRIFVNSKEKKKRKVKK